MTHCKSRQSLTPAAESSGLLARAQWESRQPEDRVSLLLKLRCHDIQSRLPHKFLTASLVLLIPQQQQRRRRPPPRRHHHHNSFSPAPVQKKLHAKHSASFSYSSRQNGSVDPAYPESDHRCHSLLAFPSLYSSPTPPSSSLLLLVHYTCTCKKKRSKSPSVRFSLSNSSNCNLRACVSLCLLPPCSLCSSSVRSVSLSLL